MRTQLIGVLSAAVILLVFRMIRGSQLTVAMDLPPRNVITKDDVVAPLLSRLPLKRLRFYDAPPPVSRPSAPRTARNVRR
ncbi:hypothetical protein [Streptomyces sp. TN58]|uniref:hypothetical protein n=1 Tax=Streptomyces sp. TN58 TaxID=234612 RepID=UPI0009508186|nr:hypothetical protein [Streptomyces sp. TN58]APU43334.1 hypothetical protein BSL84_29775 [Streptomyces sp. TN58]